MSVFSLNKDTYARSTETTTNKGTQDYLCLGRTGGSQTERMFLGFDLSSLSGKIIDSAKLYMYQYYSSYAYSGTCTFYIRRISVSWSETGVTWNAQPATVTTAQKTVSLSGNASGWRNFDITSLIQDVINNGRSFYGLGLIQTNEATTRTEKRFRSREYSSSYDAYLDITYHDMNLWGYTSGAFRRAKEVYVYSGGAWRTSKGKEYLDCKDLMQILGVGKDNVRALMRSRDFPTTQLGNRKVVSVLSFVIWQIQNLT